MNPLPAVCCPCSPLSKLTHGVHGLPVITCLLHPDPCLVGHVTMTCDVSHHQPSEGDNRGIILLSVCFLGKKIVNAPLEFKFCWRIF